VEWRPPRRAPPPRSPAIARRRPSAPATGGILPSADDAGDMIALLDVGAELPDAAGRRPNESSARVLRVELHGSLAPPPSPSRQARPRKAPRSRRGCAAAPRRRGTEGLMGLLADRTPCPSAAAVTGSPRMAEGTESSPPLDHPAGNVVRCRRACGELRLEGSVRRLRARRATLTSGSQVGRHRLVRSARGRTRPLARLLKIPRPRSACRCSAPWTRSGAAARHVPCGAARNRRHPEVVREP